MSDKFESKSVAEKKKTDSIKYLYFSRYLMLRYIVVIFLFANLFWLLILTQYQRWLGIIVSGIMTILAAIAAIEQLTKMHNRQLDVPITRYYFWLQIAVNVALVCCAISPLKNQLFPFLTNISSVYLILAILLIGILLCYLCERRIRNIRVGKDKYHKLIATSKKNN